jgi:hypothetical protein
VHQPLAERDEFQQEIRDRLEQSQQYFNSFYDKKHREMTYAIGDWVWLRLINRPVASLDIKGHNKLGPHFYGPFQIAEKIGEVAYKLNRPTGAKLHNVFHVGLLKPYHGTPPAGPGVLPTIKNGRACPQPTEVIKGRLAQGKQLLIRWEGQSAADATWVEVNAFRQEFPAFKLADELSVKEGRDVMTSLHYQRCARAQGAAPS